MRRLARPLLYAGILAIVFGLAKVHARYVADPPYDFTGSTRFGWTVAYVALLVVATYGTGLPDLPRSVRQAVTSATLAPAAAALGVSLVQLLTGDALLPRFVVLGSAALVAPWAVACVALARGGRLRAEFRDRVLLVANAADATALRHDLEEGEPERPAALLAHLEPVQLRPVGDRSRPLVEEVLLRRVNLVVLDRASLADDHIVGQAASLHENGVRVRTLSHFYDEWLGKLPLWELERASLLFDIRELHGPRYVRLKRVLDVVVALAGLVILALALPIVVVGNAVANRGPLLFRQDRVGKSSQVFQILKFRTMRTGPGVSDGEWTQEDDPRVTRFGRLLRQTHVDELPQVVNILRGELSVVGPRPEQPRYVEQLRDKLPYYDLRHLVRPGLTGWAQVKHGYAGDERDALEKLQYEFWYLGHQSLSLDLRIVGRTLRAILRALGR